MSRRALVVFAGSVTGAVALALAAPLVMAAERGSVVVQLAQAGQPPAPPAAAPPAGRGPAATPKPGYVVPPENSAGLYPVNGEPIFKAKCAGCHEPAIERAPSLKLLEARSAEDVYDVITTGIMAPMAAGLSEADKYGLVRFITGKSPVPNVVQGPDSNLCAKHGPIQANAPTWNGWGNGVENSRYQPKPGFTANDVPKLKVKWAFSYVGTKNGEPIIFGDRVFTDSMSGKVYSLDAKTGCVHWRFDYRGGSRATMTVGKLASAPSKYAVFIGDDRMDLRALDAVSGKELWKTHVYEHKVGRITGSPTLYNDIIYVPLSAAEESQGNVGAYGCCTFIGTVVAVSAKDGKVLWTQSILNDVKPRPTRKNSAGTQMYGPAGGAIWSAPTVDAKRGQLYVATGDSYTEIDHPASDAVVAMDLKTGKIRWINQVQKDDNFMSGTVNGPLGVRGPDYDFGSSPALVKVGGKDTLVTGNKSSIVYAMDPDTGKTIWATPKLGIGGASGGEVWGTATDPTQVYVPLNDAPGRGKPGLIAVRLTDGQEVWRVNAQAMPNCSVPSGRCSQGFSQAVTAIPGAVFSGSLDGHLRAYATGDGKLIWDFDTAAPRDTVNGLKNAPGGSLDMGGATIAGGMMFIHSGYGGSAGPNNLLLAFSVDGK